MKTFRLKLLLITATLFVATPAYAVEWRSFKKEQEANYEQHMDEMKAFCRQYPRSEECLAMRQTMYKTLRRQCLTDPYACYALEQVYLVDMPAVGDTTGGPAEVINGGQNINIGLWARLKNWWNSW